MGRRKGKTVAIMAALGALLVSGIAGTYWRDIELFWLTRRLHGQWQRAGQRRIHYFWEFTPSGRWTERRVSPNPGASHEYRGTYRVEVDRIKVDIANLPVDRSEISSLYRNEPGSTREFQFHFEGDYLVLNYEGQQSPDFKGCNYPGNTIYHYRRPDP